MLSGHIIGNAWKKALRCFQMHSPSSVSFPDQLFCICMLQAGRAPALAVATTLEQMSHLVCVISVVGVTSWSLSNTRVPELMAPADAGGGVCLCVGVGVGGACVHEAFGPLFTWAVYFICARTVFCFSRLGRSTAVKSDTGTVRLDGKYYMVWWNSCEMVAATLDINKTSPDFSSFPLKPL